MSVIVEWVKSPTAVTYKIERSDDGKAGTFVEIVTGLPGLQFLDLTGGTDKFYNITGVDLKGEDLKIDQPTVVYDSKLVCKIFGEVLDGTGRPETDTDVRFEVRQADSPQIVQQTAITHDSKTVCTNEVGKFEIYLMRDLLVEMFVPISQFQLLFMVPDEDEKDFTELALDFGFETKINNPF